MDEFQWNIYNTIHGTYGRTSHNIHYYHIGRANLVKNNLRKIITETNIPIVLQWRGNI